MYFTQIFCRHPIILLDHIQMRDTKPVIRNFRFMQICQIFTSEQYNDMRQSFDWCLLEV